VSKHRTPSSTWPLEVKLLIWCLVIIATLSLIASL